VTILSRSHDLLDTYTFATERRDVDLAMSLYREDAELREDPFEPPATGNLEIRARWNHHAAARFHVEFEVERSWVSGPTLLVAWHAAHTRRATAERVRRRGFSTFELDDDGLIARERRWTLERVVGTDGTFRPEPDAPLDAAPGRPLPDVPQGSDVPNQSGLATR
jgi:hypothetical protein